MAPLYHATDWDRLSYIWNDNILKRGFEREQHIHSKDGKIISMTRNFTFAKKWGDVVLQFDQQKLAQRYKIVPFNFFGTSAEGREARARCFPYQGEKRDFNFLNQFEESVLQDIKDPFRYVTKIHIKKSTYNRIFLTITEVLEQINEKYPNIKVEPFND